MNRIARLAERFCATPLPETVAADPCVTTPGEGRTGTNLMTVSEAARVLASVLAEACIWTSDQDGIWTAACQKEQGEDPSFVFENGGPDENRFSFCPYCGRHLAAVYATEPDTE